MQSLAIDRTVFMMAFGRDVDYHEMAPQRTWLDRRTGEVVWLYECDDDAYGEVGIPAGENRRGASASRRSRSAIWRFRASITANTMRSSGDS